MAQRVTGDLKDGLLSQLFEIERQIRQHSGYPFDPLQLREHLQEGIEGRFISRCGRYIINCDEKPFEPSGLTVASESEQLPGRVRGQFIFDGKIGLYLSECQQGMEFIRGNQLREEMANEPVLPANVLDFFLSNTSLIPENLKKNDNGNVRYTFFWGTVYRGSGGRQCVRCLCFNGGGWRWDCYRLGDDWDSDRPAALRAS